MDSEQRSETGANALSGMERGKAYLRVHALLVEAAAMRGLASYKAIARSWGCRIRAVGWA